MKKEIKNLLEGYYAGYITAEECLEMISISDVSQQLKENALVNRIVERITNNSIDNE